MMYNENETKMQIYFVTLQSMVFGEASKLIN